MSVELIERDKALNVGPFVLSKCGLELPKGAVPTIEEWLHTGQFIAQVHGAMQWWVGDWLLYGEGRPEWGDKYEQAVSMFGRSYQTLANWKSVAKAFPFSLRRENLSWSHHAACAGEPHEVRAKLLDAGLPVSEIKAAVQLARLERDEPIKPVKAKPHPTAREAADKIVASAIANVRRCPVDDLPRLSTRIRRIADEIDDRTLLEEWPVDATPHIAADFTADRLAAEYGVTREEILRDAKYASAVDAIEANVPGAKVKLLAGDSGLSIDDTIALAEKSPTEQVEMLADESSDDEYQNPDSIEVPIDDEWSLSCCKMDLRPAIAKWARMCPSPELPEFAAFLREMADRAERGNWTEGR